MNLPNSLTIGRFILIPIYLIVFFSDLENNKGLGFAVLILAGLTDMADGYLARKYNMVTKTGILLDPLVDKLMMISVIASFLISGMISWWAAAAFFIRDAGMIIGSAIYQFQAKKILPARIFGKLTTLLFYVSFFFIIFQFPIGDEFLWSIICFSFLTSMLYIVTLTKNKSLFSIIYKAYRGT